MCARVNSVCRIAGARARLLLEDYRCDIACRPVLEVGHCQRRMPPIPRRRAVKVSRRIGSLWTQATCQWSLGDFRQSAAETWRRRRWRLCRRCRLQEAYYVYRREVSVYICSRRVWRGSGHALHARARARSEEEDVTS